MHVNNLNNKEDAYKASSLLFKFKNIVDKF